jgi:hypothetical protein
MAKKAKKKKLTRAGMLKLVKAGETLRTFSTRTALEDVLTVTDIYDVNKDGKDIIFDLIFTTRGVGAITNAVLHDAMTGEDSPVATDELDSIRAHPINTDIVVNRKFLKMRSLITASNETPVPAGLEVNFTISGGVAPKTYAIPPATFTEVGSQVELLISIFFF